MTGYAKPFLNYGGAEGINNFLGGSGHVPHSIPNFLDFVKPSDTALSEKPMRETLRLMGITDDRPFGDIGLRLRWHRELLGMDQAEFTNRLPNVGRKAYSNWETGATRLSLNGALEIRHTYELSLDFMYEGIADALPMNLRQAWLDNPLVKNSK